MYTQTHIQTSECFLQVQEGQTSFIRESQAATKWCHLQADGKLNCLSDFSLGTHLAFFFFSKEMHFIIKCMKQ
jgi:hypothetical protein